MPTSSCLYGLLLYKKAINRSLIYNSQQNIHLIVQHHMRVVWSMTVLYGKEWCGLFIYRVFRRMETAVFARHVLQAPRAASRTTLQRARHIPAGNGAARPPTAVWGRRIDSLANSDPRQFRGTAHGVGRRKIYRVRLKTSPDENCNFSELARYFTTKFCVMILECFLHYYCSFYEILLFCIEMTGSEIQSTIFVSRQPAMQNIYLTTYQNKK